MCPGWKTVLNYIRNENVKYNTYVIRTVNKIIIKNNVDFSSWKYIPDVLNRSYDATRATKNENLNKSCRWSNRPELLVLVWLKDTFNKPVENELTSIINLRSIALDQWFVNLNCYSYFHKLSCHVASFLKLKFH